MLNQTGKKMSFQTLCTKEKQVKWRRECTTPPSVISCWLANSFLFTFLRVSNTSSSGRLMWLRYPPALRRNDNWAWNVSVWRMPDKQSRSNYTQLLLQMKRIKANESYTGQCRGCLMKRAWETVEGSVCVSEARSRFSDISSLALLFSPFAEKQHLTMNWIMFTEVCIHCRWLGESRRRGNFPN